MSNSELSIECRGEWLKYSCDEGVTGVEITWQRGLRIYPTAGFVWDSDSKRPVSQERVVEILEEMLLYLNDDSRLATVVINTDTPLAKTVQEFCQRKSHLIAGVELISNMTLLREEFEDDLKYLIEHRRPLRLGDRRVETEEQLKDYYRDKGLKF